MEEVKTTDLWNLYQRGVNYNRMHGLYDDTEKNYDFFYGNQWRGAKLGDIQPVVKNIVKPIIKYKIGVINTYQYQAVLNIMGNVSKEEKELVEKVCKSLNKALEKSWETTKIPSKIRTCVKDSGINSEGIIYFYEEDGEIQSEVIDKTNIYFGNENDDDIQSQPYILISFRRPVEEIREYAKKLEISEEEIENIVSDSETMEQAGYKNETDEVSPMCLVLLKLYKKDGTIHMEKATKTVKLIEDTDTQMTLYPVAHLIWEEVKGSARGNGEVKYIIPNQIEINKMEVRRIVASKQCSAPKLAVNTEYVSNPESLNQIGTTIKLHGVPADDVKKVVAYLQPAQMSSDAANLENELKTDTRELAGAGDTVTGQIDPTKASGKAILAVQQASQQPLNEQLERYKDFIEDIARIHIAMWEVYMVDGIEITIEQKDENGETIEIPQTISNEELKELKLNIKVDITPRSAYDKYAQEMSLENLLVKDLITLEEYTDALDEDSTMPKVKLEKIMKERAEKQRKIDEMQAQLQDKQNQLQQMLTQEETTDNQFQLLQGGMSSKFNEAMQKVGEEVAV